MQFPCFAFSHAKNSKLRNYIISPLQILFPDHERAIWDPGMGKGFGHGQKEAKKGERQPSGVRGHTSTFDLQESS
jgi:hypothetical protein